MGQPREPSEKIHDRYGNIATTYQYYTTIFRVDRNFIQRKIAHCEPLVIEALGVYAQRYLWRDELPVYPVMTTSDKNGGWGHLMPFWFKPQDRPMPFYTLDNWALFALVYAHSFGPSNEAKELVKQVFTIENVGQVIVGTNLQLPFLPATDGHGSFFRQGMLPFLLSILWLDEDTRQSWLRLHQLGSAHFIKTQNLTSHDDPVATLNNLEHTIFNRLERNTVNNDKAVAAFLSVVDDPNQMTTTPSLLSLYQDMFGAINLGITALATYYQDKPLKAWRDWVMPELIMPYRLPDYGTEAIKNLLTTI